MEQLIKNMFLEAKSNPKELSILIDKYLVPSHLEKKTNAEISTPSKLRNEMLDLVPKNFWTKPRKVFEPCAGKGGFLIDLIDRFMIGLEPSISDPDERRRLIVEECIYFADINPLNVYICFLLLDPDDDYSRINYYEGNTLELDINEHFELEGFDLVVGNPPYNSYGSIGTGNTIWQLFTKSALLRWINKNGYLLFVHPSGWRKPESEKSKYNGFFDLMTNKNQMLYLSIHDTKDGMKTFNCGTRYDWYLIQKNKATKNTIIIDENGNENSIYLPSWKFLPNGNLEMIRKIMAAGNNDNCEIMYSRSNYGTDRKWTSNKQTEIFKYPLIHTTPKNEIRYFYSSINNKGHFGIKKVIFGDSGINSSIMDTKGIYGMTEQSMAIPYELDEIGLKIKLAIESENFKQVLKNCSWSNFRIDWRMFKYFKKDFWKEFI